MQEGYLSQYNLLEDFQWPLSAHRAVVCPGPNSDNEHPETDVQDFDVSHTTYGFTCLLMTSTRKKAGTTDVGDIGRSRPKGMTDSMKEQAKAAPAGRTGETEEKTTRSWWQLHDHVDSLSMALVHFTDNLFGTQVDVNTALSNPSGLRKSSCDGISDQYLTVASACSFGPPFHPRRTGRSGPRVFFLLAMPMRT